jgi:hypothetical protein
MSRCFVYSLGVLCLAISFTNFSFSQAPPSADSYVTTAMPLGNFASSPILPVQPDTTSYVKLNLGALPSNVRIAKATLRLYVDAVTAPGSFDVYAVNGNWREGSLTALNAPLFGASATGGQPVAITKASVNQFVLVDITSLAQGWMDGSIVNNGIALALTSATGSFSFDSKESGGSGHQPELIVVAGAPEMISERAPAPVISRSLVSQNLQGPSSPYINNGTTTQTGASFNIDGSGTAATFNATSQFFLNGVPVLGNIGSTGLFLGPGSGQSNAGVENTFLGVSAGQANTTGSYLTFLGTLSGAANTTGNYNSFLGRNAGAANTTGSYNSFLGMGAGRNNTTGSFLTFLGMQAGLANTSGGENSFVGTYSGFSNTTGSYSSFLGAQSGYSNTTGNYNSFIGYNSGYANTTGGYNSFLGMGAGRNNTTGSYLTFLGMQSGLANTTGNSNTFVGTYSGINNTTGSSNTFLGYNAGFNASPAASNNVYISSLGAPAENGAIRLGNPSSQTSAYIAGISGATTNAGVPVFIDSTGKLGTAGGIGGGGGVTSFNGRTGAVVPASGDYTFSLLGGTLGSSQLSGTYSNAVTLNNASNSFAGTFAGNGTGLTGVLPAAGSPSYIQNGTTQQTGNLNISGNGTLGGTLSAAVVNSSLSYQIGGSAVLNIQSPTGANLFLGVGAGANNVSSQGLGNTFSGYSAGHTNSTGSNNTFFGSSAGYSNTTGNQNTFYGFGAGYQSTFGSQNTFIGLNAGGQNTTGSNNVFLGNGAGANDTTGNSNIYLGNAGCTPPCTESNIIRIGTQGNTAGQQNTTYIAGVYGNAPAGALPVVINAAGQMGTTTAGIGVTSFNGRTGAVVPASGDYTFSLLGGTLGSSQLGGTYGNAVMLNNSSNSFAGTFAGNGVGLTGVLPAAGSPNYIQNGTTTQNANFNIGGSGSAGGDLNAGGVYRIGGNAVVNIGLPADGNLFVGVGAGVHNAPGTGLYNVFIGGSAGNSNTTASGNAFIGFQAGVANTTGGANTFLGDSAGLSNQTGCCNLFTGNASGFSNTTGSGNAFAGPNAGYSNTTGDNNVFAGSSAGYSNTTGGNNTTLGTLAGQHLVAGSNNIDIGYNTGPASDESNTVRIGVPGTQTATFMAGISGAPTNGGAPVFIDSNGKLGTTGGIGGGGGVTSFNGRSGAVFSMFGDYSFPMLVGTLADFQLSGSYSSFVQFNNAFGNFSGTFGGTFFGNGSGLTGVVTAPGAPFYIQNTTSQQTGANFNIDGSGVLGGTLSAATVNAGSAYSISTSPVLSIGSKADGNLFVGVLSGPANIAGMATGNTFVGAGSGQFNTSGYGNSFFGYGSGGPTNAGHSNVMSGTQVGNSNTSGSDNVFSGFQAGFNNSTGSRNIFIGTLAGSNIQKGSNNIAIGYLAGPGADTSNSTYISGIYSSNVSGSAVFVNPSGQLGTLTSSRRFKEQINDMGDSSSALMKLRPVTFLYKPEYEKGPRTLQYGLIAEEVADVYPDLVAYEPDGKPYTVKYQYLTTMLLNEAQKQYRRAEAEAKVISQQQDEIESLRKQSEEFQRRLERLERALGTDIKLAEKR